MKQKYNRYTVKIIPMSRGERLPTLLDNGVPLFDATIYALAEIRGRNLAANTVQQALRAVMVLHIFLDTHGINLQDRLKEGHLLALHEIEALVAHCRLALPEMWKASKAISVPARSGKHLSLEKMQQRLTPEKISTVVSAFTLTRLLYIRNYLIWLVNDKISRYGLSKDLRMRLLEARDLVSRGITARLPRKDRRGGLGGREGLDREEQKVLLHAVSPHSGENPWFDMHTRVRNELMIRWLLEFGLRRGELLNLRISDISFQKKVVAITRRADDPTDPRLHQPLNKTNDREHDMFDGILFMTREYILRFRSQLPLARKHDFLFVSSDGIPLSHSSFTKIFSTLRNKCHKLPQSLCGHVLRHSWNENFSDLSDSIEWSDAEEARYREYLQGWRQNSGTAATYCQRGIRRRANEASVKLQERLEKSWPQ